MSRLYLIPSTLVIFLLLLPSITLAEARTYPPTANLASPYNGDSFYEGQVAFLYAYGSTGNGSSITQYRWRMRPTGGSWTNISWSYSDYYSFPSLAPGQRRQTYELELTVWNSYGSDSESIQVTVVRDYESYYYLKDHLGTVRTTINDQGNVVGYDDYYPFGLAMPGRSSNSGNPNDTYKFTGHERDDEANLTLDYMIARNYDPIIGRFLQIDPILHEQSPLELLEMEPRLLSNSSYSYVFGNPLRLIDPDGRCPEPADKEGTVCVALFIQAENALGLKGDNRDFSSSSDPEKSRIFLHIDVENQSFTPTANPTCTTGGECKDPLSTNVIDVAFGEDGEFTVSFSAKNSVLPGPAIDGEINFTPDGKGGFNTLGNRDAFPSAEAYFWKGGKPTTLFQRTEKTPFHLIPLWINDKWKK
ncbi:MAG: hypothetical protein CL666_01335 [Balneola sp.]|nr:hypothetical protein [Balneola sp.]|tara:strand:- start:25899 stop:27149 length:1251 start_codon:yes stop_codon:yes gene_type:complete